MNAGDHYGLAWSIAIKHGYCDRARRLGVSSEDLIQDAMLCAVKSAEKYDKSKSKESTFLYDLMYWGMRDTLERCSRMQREVALPSASAIDSLVHDSSMRGHHRCFSNDEQEYNSHKEDQIQAMKDGIEMLKSKWPVRYQVAKLMLEGKTNVEIAKIRQCTPAAVSLIRAKVLDHLRWVIGVC